MIPVLPPAGIVQPQHRLPGVYPALVTDVQDPDGQGRVKVSLAFVNAEQGPPAATWARLATFMAGGNRGSWFIPDVDDEVLVAFLAGDPRHPVVIGALWNGVDQPPETMDPENTVRSITTRSGHRLSFDDSTGAEMVQLETQGRHKLTLDDGSGGTVTLSHSNGASIKIDAAGNISITANTKVTVDAPAGMDISAAMVKVDAPMSLFSGVVKCDALITNSVVSSSYTPGAGNVW